MIGKLTQSDPMIVNRAKGLIEIRDKFIALISVLFTLQRVIDYSEFISKFLFPISAIHHFNGISIIAAENT